MPSVRERCVCAHGYRQLGINIQSFEEGIEEELQRSCPQDIPHRRMEGTVGEIPELISHDPSLAPDEAERTRRVVRIEPNGQESCGGLGTMGLGILRHPD